MKPYILTPGNGIELETSIPTYFEVWEALISPAGFGSIPTLMGKPQTLVAIRRPHGNCGLYESIISSLQLIIASH